MAKRVQVVLNEDVLSRYLALANRLAEDGATPPSADGLLGLRGVLEAPEEEEDAEAKAAVEAAMAASVEAALDALKANLAKKPEGNDRSQVKSIWAGECDISLGNTYYMGEMLADPEQVEWANSVNLVFPKFEGGGTHVNVSGVAMTQSAPNKEAALKLIATTPGAARAVNRISIERQLLQMFGSGLTPDDLAEITDAAMGERAECVMLNKGPHILGAIRTLDDILKRMQSHQSKKRPMLRALKAWRGTRWARSAA